MAQHAKKRQRIRKLRTRAARLSALAKKGKKADTVYLRGIYIADLLKKKR